MDEELRRVERGGPSVELARRLRQRGDLAGAGRLLSDLARGGDPEARALLEAWFPPGPEVLERIALLRADEAVAAPAALRAGLELLGACDPRLDEVFREYASRVEAAARDGLRFLRDPGPAQWPIGPGLGPFLDGPRGARLEALARHGPGDPHLLALARPSGAEALGLWERVGASDGLVSPGMRVGILALVGRSEEPGCAPVLREVLDQGSRLVERIEAWAGLAALGEAARPPALAGGLGPRPAWLRRPGPGVRDGPTGCLSRDALEVAGWSGPDWLVLVEVDGFLALLEALGLAGCDRLVAAAGAALQREAGDRVVRWSRDAFLVRWEGDDGPALAERLRRVMREVHAAAPGGEPVHVTASVGAARADVFGLALDLAERAVLDVRRRGGDGAAWV